MNDQPLLTERRDRVLLITLNRPDARNAVNLAMAEAMAAALDELDGDDELSVGVIAGEGKGFSSGMDLKAFATGERPWARRPRLRRDRPEAGREAADRRDRGLRRRRRPGDRPRLRPDRRRQGRQARHPGGEARPGRRRRRAPAAAPPPARGDRDGARAHRRDDHRRAWRRARPGQPPRRARARHSTSRSSSPGRSRRTPRSRLRPRRSILNHQGSWDDETFWAKQGEIVAPVFTSEDAIEGATAFVRSATRTGAAASRLAPYVPLARVRGSEPST